MRPLRDLPLRLKGLLVVLIPLSALLVFSIAFYGVEEENRSASLWVRHTLQVLSLLQSVNAHLDQAENAVRTYQADRQPHWLQAYNDARGELPSVFNRLQDLTADNSSQMARLNRIRRLSSQRLQYLEGLRSGTAPQDDGGVSHQLRAELEGAKVDEQRVLQQRQQHERDIWGRSQALIIAAILFAPAGGVLAMFLFTRGIAQRIHRLDENARQLARGQPFETPDPSGDELGRLEASLAQAAALLARREAELTSARDQLEARVQERTGELAETNAALASEIAERTRAQDSLRSTNLTLNGLIEASPLAIFCLDESGQVLSWNQAAESMFGWTREEVVNHPLPGPEGEAGFADLAAGLQREETIRGVEKRRSRKDGSLLHTRLWTAPIRDEEGRLNAYIAILADESEQRRLEEQFVQAQKMEAVGRLAGGVAHDFNNLITIISGYAQMLQENLAGDATLREYAGEVMEASNRAARLSGQLLAFSRRQATQPKLLDLGELVSNIEKMLRRVIGEDIELRTALMPARCVIKADPGQMEQVLLNLAVNARDAMPEGGQLTIETSVIELDESYCRLHAEVTPGPYVMLAVSDTGHGMDPETRKHLFEPFFTTKEKGRGTGLGLSTVYGIVRQHGGHVWVYSEVGQGSSFKLYFPQAETSVRAEPAPPRPELPRGSETILVVEDEDAVRKLIGGLLEHQGYRVSAAASGPEALELFERMGGRIDLLLTDVVMPGMNGRQVAEALAARQPGLKVLYLSGYTDNVVLQRGILESEAEFMQKPFTPDSLAQRVRRILDRSSEARQS